MITSGLLSTLILLVTGTLQSFFVMTVNLVAKEHPSFDWQLNSFVGSNSPFSSSATASCPKKVHSW